MNDLTILFYTANVIQDYFASKVRNHLLGVIEDIPLISISQKPINFGNNICVGDIGISTYNIYKQILIGAKEAKTTWLGMAEDDCLYSKSHFEHRPPDEDTFSYNINRWNLDPIGVYFHRTRAGMCMCIAPRLKLIEVLENRFKKFPELLPREKLTGFSEPGRERTNKFMEEDSILETFESEVPTICFNHRTGLGGRRRMMRKDKVVDYLEPWGKASDLWEEYTNEYRS